MLIPLFTDDQLCRFEYFYREVFIERNMYTRTDDANIESFKEFFVRMQDIPVIKVSQQQYSVLRFAFIKQKGMRILEDHGDNFQRLYLHRVSCREMNVVAYDATGYRLVESLLQISGIHAVRQVAEYVYVNNYEFIDSNISGQLFVSAQIPTYFNNIKKYYMEFQNHLKFTNTECAEMKNDFEANINI